MNYNEHILDYKAHKDNDYLNDLLSNMNQCTENYHECEFTPKENYFVELHYAKGRETYPEKNCHDCDTDEHSEYVCIKCEVNQSKGENK